MARTKKERNICPQLHCRNFTAGENSPDVELPLEELETLRLVDFEKLEQSAAAVRMGISRGTLQRMLYSARSKVAEALTRGKSIHIVDGTDTERCCALSLRCRHCHIDSTPDITPLQGEIMNIAVCCENNEVFQHFGHTPEFALFEIADGAIKTKRILSTGDSGHGALAGMLRELCVDLLLCGGIGGGAQQALAANNIALIGGVEGTVDDVVNAYLAGTLTNNKNFGCSHHHGTEENHNCHCGK